MSPSRSALVASLFVMTLAAALFAQPSTDVIRGRVTDPDAKPVQGVEVRASSYVGGVTKTATTDNGGRRTIIQTLPGTTSRDSKAPPPGDSTPNLVMFGPAFRD